MYRDIRAVLLTTVTAAVGRRGELVRRPRFPGPAGQAATGVRARPHRAATPLPHAGGLEAVPAGTLLPRHGNLWTGHMTEAVEQARAPDLLPRSGLPSLQAELVSLRVGHDDAPAVRLVDLVQHGRAAGDELRATLPHLGTATIGARLLVPDVDIEVDPVLAGIALRHPLEEQPRAGTVGVDERVVAVPLLGRQPEVLGEPLPAVEAGWQRLADVAQGTSSELRQPRRVVCVEGHREPHAHRALRCAYRSRSREISAPWCSISRLMCSTSAAIGWWVYGPSAGPHRVASPSSPSRRTPSIQPA